VNGLQDGDFVIVFIQQAYQPVSGLDGEVSDWLDIDEHALTFYGRAKSPLFIVPKLNLFGLSMFEKSFFMRGKKQSISPFQDQTPKQQKT
jgi:hypothetical protein